VSWASAGSSGKIGRGGDLPGERAQVGRVGTGPRGDGPVGRAAVPGGFDPLFARGAVGAVLSVVADAAGEELTRRILLQLPAGYGLLFGCPEPT
jgi:hypothetical protein